jgi:hypothetical protein
MNREVLRQQGFLYPEAGFRAFGHHDIAFLLSGSYPDWAIPASITLAETGSGMREELEKHDGPVLLSSEDFYLFPRPSELRRFLMEAGLGNDEDIRIVVYLRRQDAAIESWYNQTIKAQGAIHQIDEFVETTRPLWDYSVQLEKWSSVFGVERILVRRYEEDGLSGGSLIHDFCRTIGLDVEPLLVEKLRPNSRLNRDALEFQRLINSLPGPIPRKRRLMNQLIALSEESAGSGLFFDGPLLSSTARRQLLEYYSEGNLSVARVYMNSQELFRAFDAAGELTDDGTYYGLTLDKLAMMLGWLLIDRSGGAPNVQASP